MLWLLLFGFLLSKWNFSRIFRQETTNKTNYTLYSGRPSTVVDTITQLVSTDCLSVCLSVYLSISVCLSMSLKPFSGCINFKWPPIHGIELKSLSTEPTRPGPGRHLSSLIGGRWCWGCGEDEATADSEIVIYFSRASTLAHHSWGVVVLFHWIMNIPP